MLRDDLEINAIRAVRHRISQEHNHDPKLLIESYRHLQQSYSDRVLPGVKSAHEHIEAVVYSIPAIETHVLAENKPEPFPQVEDVDA